MKRRLYYVKTQFGKRGHEQYNVAVYKIAQTADVKLIDIRSALWEHRNYCGYLNTEDIHPNEDGHGLIAKAVAQQIEQLILS